MRRISLVVSDVDGTLVTQAKVLTERAAAAVRRLHENGIAFSICSSRPPFGMRMLIEPLSLKLPFGGYNGGEIVEPDFSVVERKPIPPEIARETVQFFREHRIDCWVFSGQRWLVLNPAGDYVDRETRTVATPPTVVPQFIDEHLAAAGKIVGPSRDLDRIADLARTIRSRLAARASVVQSQPYYCDVTAPGIDKGRLIEVLASRLGISSEEVLVLGDMENDVQMFRQAGFAVAMGNAPDAVKREAQAVTLSNEEDGFAAAIERYVFGD